jgi:hypothetical protein
MTGKWNHLKESSVKYLIFHVFFMNLQKYARISFNFSLVDINRKGRKTFSRKNTDSSLPSVVTLECGAKIAWV